MLLKSRMGANECTEMVRRSAVREMVRSGPCRHLTRALLPGALQHAGAATYVRGDVLDLGSRPAERGSA